MRSRGFALVIVLWTLVLLSLIVTHIVATGRTETVIAANLVANAQAESQADGAVIEAVFRLIDASDAHWSADGIPHVLNLDRAKATVRITPENGKINPNATPASLMAALLTACGADAANSQALAVAILDWRTSGTAAQNRAKRVSYAQAGLDYAPPNAPFELLDELKRVLGMTPELFQQLKPHLSLFQSDIPDIRMADPVVAAALQAVGLGATAGRPLPVVRTVSIVASVATDRGGHFERRAVIDIRPAAPQGYAILDWNSGADPE